MNQPAQPPPTSETNMKTSNSLTISDFFFDNDERDGKENFSLWTKPTPEILKLFSSTKSLGCMMEKKGKKTGMCIKRYYILVDHYLAYKHSSDASKIVKVMDLDRVRVEYYEVQYSNKVKYAFKFRKNHDMCELMTRTWEIYCLFKERFEKLCIQTDFTTKYMIEKLIGKGSFGRVYLVKRISDGQLFASKMFFKEIMAKDKKAKPTLINEINILRALDHPGIMKLYEVHETSISIHLIVELLSGGELFEKLKEKKNYKEKDCAALLTKMIEPLIYIHSKNIIHRDLKPENLILRNKDSQFDIVIADFGLSTELSPKTLIHARCGTPGYCAPEILNSKSGKMEYDGKCDVFSLGCVFYNIITGKHPFYHKVGKMVFYQNRLCDINFNHPKILSLSESGQELMKSLLSKDPKKRPTFEEVIKHDFFTKPKKNYDVVPPKIPKNIISIAGFPSVDEKKNSLDIIPRNSTQEVKKIDSHVDYGSFHVGRSNIFRGHVETVQTMQDGGGFLSPVIINAETSSPGIPNQRGNYRRSSFSRFSAAGRDITSFRDNPLMRDSPSISINISIVKSDNSNVLSMKDEANLSKSSRTNSRLQQSAMSRTVGLSAEIQEESESEDDSQAPTAEKSPVFRILSRMRSVTLKNPFMADENNDESLLHIKVGKMRSNSASVRSLNNSRVLQDNVSNHNASIPNVSLSKLKNSREFDTESVASSLAVRKLGF